MIIDDEKVTTEEVRQWKGLHLLHFQGSTCSQKVRLLLRELSLDWTAHNINLLKHENASAWFLGINPRGVVPVLIDDGVVHVESNDIIAYLDDRYAPPGSSFLFDNNDANASSAAILLEKEHSLHRDLRLLTMEFGPLRMKTEQQIAQQEGNGTPDEERDTEVRWWRERLRTANAAEHIAAACSRISAALTDLDNTLAVQAFLVGDRISIVDIAWFVNIQRLQRIGFPVSRFANLYEYYLKLASRPAFLEDAKHPASKVGQVVFAAYRFKNRVKGRALESFL